jgi:hypothetical protein
MNYFEPRVAVAAALLCSGIACHAGRPLATEDPDILDQRECEWESFAARESAAGNPAVNGWTTQMGCGVGYSTQIALAYGRARSAGLNAQGLTLVGKTGLVERTDDAMGLALAWALGSEKAPGSSSFKNELSQLKLVAAMGLAEHLTAFANLGWVHSKSARASSTTWNLAAEYALASGVDALAEVYGDDRTKPWLGAGVRWKLTQQLNVNSSYSVQRETPQIKLWTVGVNLVF